MLLCCAINWIRRLYRNAWVLPRIHQTYGKLSLSETFDRIYANAIWGSEPGKKFCSGLGSQGVAADEYCKNVIAFIRALQIQSVVDIGCGDFRLGSRIVSESGVRYVGVGIVQKLVDRNNAEFGSERIVFKCGNLVTGPLPGGQLCHVRQVLQHLSNAEIEAALTQISKYPFALITEHVCKFPKRFNHDKPHGPDVRTEYGSGVYLEHPPFSRQITVAWETEWDADSTLRTILMSNPLSAF